MILRSRGSICGAILLTGPTGSVGVIGPRRPDGGCSVVEDPDLDARHVHPLWNTGTDGLLHVRATIARDALTSRRFSAWHIPGRKRIAHAGTELVITAVHGPHRLRASLSPELEEGATCDVVVPLDAPLRARLPEYQEQDRVLQGEVPRPSPHQATRAALLHLRALQALDATQAGARHRDIAEALFGAEAVQGRWNADSELRAQVRHLLARAEGLMHGGYLALAGVRQQPTRDPGDELAH